MTIRRKLIIGIIAIFSIFGIYLLYLNYFSAPANPPIFGVTFTPQYATYLGLDWKKAYKDVLDDLKVRNLRLVAYWDQIELSPGHYDFSELDYEVKEASSRNATILLAMGKKAPRWPECYQPAWGDRTSLFKMYQAVVNRYKNNPLVIAWQVENEPLFNFGSCGTSTAADLKVEADYVRSLDPTRLVVITDSGEWGPWRPLKGSADILGISIYRQAYNQTLGYVNLKFPLVYYYLKGYLTGWVPEKVWATELQMEPWGQNGLTGLSIADQTKILSIEQFTKSLHYISASNYSRVYLWGVEWWLWAKSQGHPEYWEAVRHVIPAPEPESSYNN
ncbi:MAG: cellulase family glycosylhydrolase [candidate division WWE3 bacterium]|nr:cellulase family glycosylhydrolase [candidate division WWE3 bacterium]